MPDPLMKKGTPRRSPFAAEPAGPLDLLPHVLRAKEHASRGLAQRLGALRLRLPSGRWATIGGCLALQLLAVVAVYQAHALYVTPGLRQAGAAEGSNFRVSLLEQQDQGALPGGLEQLSEVANANRGGRLRRGQGLLRGSEVPGSSAAVSGGGSTGSRVSIGGGAAAPCAGAGCASNCTVRLEEASEELLREEIDRIAKSLADERLAAWPRGTIDAAAPSELEDKVRRGEAFKRSGAAVQRIVDEPFGPQSGSNVPGVEDIHAELAKYNAAMVAAMTTNVADAAARQHRATAAELGLQPVDGMADLGSLEARMQFLNQLYEEVQARETLAVCMAATTSADLWGVRRELLPWLQYHTELGVTRFYLLYDGSDPEAVSLLSRIAHVRLLHLHPPWASSEEKAKFEFYARAAKQWGGQPGNYELMVKQGYGEQEALRLAEADAMDWLLHVDPDELFHPGGPVASITAVLARQPPHVPAVRFMNFEGQPEAGDLVNRFEQVTLFRVHKHFITPEAFYYRSKYKLGDNIVFLTLYANGKSAVRVGSGARQLGPHFFAGDPSPRWQTQENPRGEWRNVVSDDSVVLHYAYSYMSDVESKANRSCPPSYLEAARKGDRSKIKACFVIDFDQDAYLAAASGRAAVEDFFYSRMVLSEGSRVRCQDPENDNMEGWCTLPNIDRFKYLMEKVGLMRRLHGPQLIIRAHERAIQAGMRQRRSGGGSGKGSS